MQVQPTGCSASSSAGAGQKDKSKATKKGDEPGQDSKIEAIKKYSLNFLGHGYNRLEENSENRMLERVVEDFSTDLVDLPKASV